MVSRSIPSVTICPRAASTRCVMVSIVARLPRRTLLVLPHAAPIPLPPRESLADARARGRKIITVLRRRYLDPRVPLRHENSLQLLVATILSAQCTDAMEDRK